MRVRNRALIGNLFRSARLFSEAWRCAPTVVFSPRLDYTLVRNACLASQSLSLQSTDGWITRSSVSDSIDS
ncbi:BZ3500_MvSof-1268-A1-R1_Chr3-1g05951 [Microbotryum saponariae]|uniref:BZ3500_MvSof-1268-A1-R1_Chr3-1g05951 protein n=1 Tax=Microbotryum saponariae TaxID=289078 RepID=A0A2X0L3A0_9BASI|nr:BZ3500_MvSof-1268-A1-R1_Chr3-1g05951 [Microbotryum saponariae]SDA05141.1 BZ3501_MvSof-1269-A2-R1_Chr3-1g05621 [Microbotryum saponariae]